MCYEMNRYLVQMEGGMKSITIHGLDDSLYDKVKDKAEKNDLSLNKTIKQILESFFGVKKGTEIDNSKKFEKFLGVWNKSDLEEFENSTKDFGHINQADWK